jgi:hypothetical protein
MMLRPACVADPMDVCLRYEEQVKKCLGPRKLASDQVYRLKYNFRDLGCVQQFSQASAIGLVEVLGVYWTEVVVGKSSS